MQKTFLLRKPRLVAVLLHQLVHWLEVPLKEPSLQDITTRVDGSRPVAQIYLCFVSKTAEQIKIQEGNTEESRVGVNWLKTPTTSASHKLVRNHTLYQAVKEPSPVGQNEHVPFWNGVWGIQFTPPTWPVALPCFCAQHEHALIRIVASFFFFGSLGCNSKLLRLLAFWEFN